MKGLAAEERLIVEGAGAAAVAAIMAGKASAPGQRVVAMVTGEQRRFAEVAGYDFVGREGRISIRLGRLRAGWFSTSTMASATSSGDSFRSDPADDSRPENPVATDPGST